MRHVLRTFLLLLAPPVTVACDHGAVFSVEAPPPLGPYSAVLPRRLTFFSGDDRTPSVSGSRIVFSRQSDQEPSAYLPTGRETCLAFLPLEGGTLERTLCPHRLVPQPDSLVDTWFEPALAPDGSRIAFQWQRGLRISALGYLDNYLMVTDVDHPADTLAFRRLVRYVEPGQQNPRRADVATRITWVTANRLRFLATVERIFKVKGGGAERVTDTLYVPLAIMEADLTSGDMTVVPGSDSAIAYTAAPDGALWIVRERNPATLLRLDPTTGARSVAGTFTGPVRDLITVDGAPLAIVGTDRIERLLPATGSIAVVATFTAPPVHLAPAGGRRWVVELEQFLRPFGAPTDLWLYELP